MYCIDCELPADKRNCLNCPYMKFIRTSYDDLGNKIIKEEYKKKED